MIRVPAGAGRSIKNVMEDDEYGMISCAAGSDMVYYQ